MSSPFSIKPATAQAFAPRKKETMNVRELFITYLHERGWTLDTEATVKLRHDKKVQDPNAFVRTAQDGGTWHLWLDYVVDGGYRYRTDNTLRGLRLWKAVDEGDKPRVWRMENTARTTYDPHRLWEVTGRDIGNDYGRALRMRAERVGTDPDLVVWLAAEAGYLERQRLAEQEARRKAEYEARTRPIPDVTVSEHEWRTLTYDLKRKVEAMYQANGLSNVHALLGDVEDKLAAIRAVITKNDPA